jgi:hypothetical protein
MFQQFEANTWDLCSSRAQRPLFSAQSNHASVCDDSEAAIAAMVQKAFGRQNRFDVIIPQCLFTPECLYASPQQSAELMTRFHTQLSL